MWKLIFLCTLLWLLVTIFRRVLGNPGKPAHSDHEQDTHTSHEYQRENPSETMVQCAVCHVHLPRSEAFLIKGNFYCSQQHVEHR